MFLFIARHAWAGEFGDPAWPDDSLRELTADGIQRYRHLIKQLAGRGFAPERIATSPYIRCRQTADLISEGVMSKPVVEEVAALAPGSDLRSLFTWSAQHPGQDLCWVGHNPDVEIMTAKLIGGTNGRVRFAKGAISAIRFEGPLAPAGGELHWHLTAKALGV